MWMIGPNSWAEPPVIVMHITLWIRVFILLMNICRSEMPSYHIAKDLSHAKTLGDLVGCVSN